MTTKQPCTNTDCNMRIHKKGNGCQKYDDVRDCRHYEPEQHSYDKILDRMEGEIPKNGR